MHQGKTFLDKGTFGTNLFLHIFSLMPKIIKIFKELKLLRIFFTQSTMRMHLLIYIQNIYCLFKMQFLTFDLKVCI